MREKWRLGLHSYQGEVLEGYKKKRHTLQKPENNKLSLFFFSLSCSSSALLSSCVAFFFFPLSASPTFSVLSVLTRINFNRMPQQISNRSTPRILFGSSHTKKKKEKIHESSAFNIEQFAWSSVFRCCVFFFFFIYFSAIFFCCRRFSCKKGVFFSFFFSLLHFQSFASPPVSSFAYRGNAQMSARHSFLPSFFYSCPFLFHVTNERNSMQLNSLSKGKVNKKKKKTTPQTAQNFWFRFRCTWKMRDSILKHTQKKPHSFL